MSQSIKKLDSKGRLSLGAEFANSTVIIEEVLPGEFVIKAADVIPKMESWLYKNTKALAQVRRGLAEAKEGKLVRPRKLHEEDSSWIKDLSD